MRTLFIDTPIFSGASVYEISSPNRAILTKMVVINTAGTGTATASLYNRAFTSDAIDLTAQISSDDAKVILKSTYPVMLPFAVGDTVTVASSSVGGYNTSHIITDRIDQYSVKTNQNYSALGSGGTATLAVPAVDKNLYLIAQATAVAGVAVFEGSSWVVLASADALPKGQSVKTNKLYLDAGASGNYRASLTFLLPE